MTSTTIAGSAFACQPAADSAAVFAVGVVTTGLDDGAMLGDGPLNELAGRVETAGNGSPPLLFPVVEGEVD
jgi:hypothetical protein